MDLTGKVALITGGSKGIGFGIAEKLVQADMQVALLARKGDEAKAAAESLNKNNDNAALGLQADVRNPASLQDTVQQAVSHFGKIDVAVANAGIGAFAPIGELTIEDWQRTIDTNLSGVFYTAKAVLEELIKNKGYLITIASLAGTNFFENGAAYNASKFGVVGLTQAIMLDVRQKGVKVSTIMPGSVATGFNDRTVDKKADAWKIQPEDVGQIVADLLKMPARTLPSKVEVRPSMPPGK